MIAQIPAEGISEAAPIGDSREFRIVCACGDPAHTHTLVVDQDGDVSTVTIYADLTTDYWNSPFKARYDIKNVFLSRFDWYWKGTLNSIINRLRVTRDVWVHGHAKYEATFLLTAQAATNYAAAIMRTVVVPVNKDTSNDQDKN